MKKGLLSLILIGLSIIYIPNTTLGQSSPVTVETKKEKKGFFGKVGGFFGDLFGGKKKKRKNIRKETNANILRTKEINSQFSQILQKLGDYRSAMGNFENSKYSFLRSESEEVNSSNERTFEIVSNKLNQGREYLDKLNYLLPRIEVLDSRKDFKNAEFLLFKMGDIEKGYKLSFQLFSEANRKLLNLERRERDIRSKEIERNRLAKSFVDRMDRIRKNFEKDIKKIPGGYRKEFQSSLEELMLSVESFYNEGIRKVQNETQVQEVEKPSQIENNIRVLESLAYTLKANEQNWESQLRRINENINKSIEDLRNSQVKIIDEARLIYRKTREKLQIAEKILGRKQDEKLFKQFELMKRDLAQMGNYIETLTTSYNEGTFKPEIRNKIKELRNKFDGEFYLLQTLGNQYEVAKANEIYKKIKKHYDRTKVSELIKNQVSFIEDQQVLIGSFELRGIVDRSLRALKDLENGYKDFENLYKEYFSNNENSKKYDELVKTNERLHFLGDQVKKLNRYAHKAKRDLIKSTDYTILDFLEDIPRKRTGLLTEKNQIHGNIKNIQEEMTGSKPPEEFLNTLRDFSQKVQHESDRFDQGDQLILKLEKKARSSKRNRLGYLNQIYEALKAQERIVSSFKSLEKSIYQLYHKFQGRLEKDPDTINKTYKILVSQIKKGEKRISSLTNKYVKTLDLFDETNRIHKQLKINIPFSITNDWKKLQNIISKAQTEYDSMKGLTPNNPATMTVSDLKRRVQEAKVKYKNLKGNTIEGISLAESIEKDLNVAKEDAQQVEENFADINKVKQFLSGKLKEAYLIQKKIKRTLENLTTQAQESESSLPNPLGAVVRENLKKLKEIVTQIGKLEKMALSKAKEVHELVNEVWTFANQNRPQEAQKRLPGIENLLAEAQKIFNQVREVEENFSETLNEIVLALNESNEETKDPLFPFSWHLENIGQKNFARKRGVAGMDINAKKTYGLYNIQGKGIRVAVSDTGVEIGHEDLADNIWHEGNRNYGIGNYPGSWKGDPTPQADANGLEHGTNVAGIIGAVKGNGLGSHGIAPMAQVSGLRYLDLENGSYWSMKKDQAMGDFDIFNYSYGSNTCAFTEYPFYYEKVLAWGTRNLREGKGALYVKSSGNEYKNPQKHCDASKKGNYYGNSALEGVNSLPYIIVVAAANAAGKKSSYSSPGPNIWITGFGGEYGRYRPAIMTTDLSGCSKGSRPSSTNRFQSNQAPEAQEHDPECNYTSTFNGTSSAAPVISGALALILEANPKLTWRDVKHILASTARKIDDRGPLKHPSRKNLKGHQFLPGWVINGAGYQYHHYYGFGLIDVDKAVEMAKSYKLGQLGKFRESYYDLGEVLYGSGDIEVPIPDKSAEGAIHKIYVNDNYTIEALQLYISSDHQAPKDLGVELISPQGTRSVLMTINSNITQGQLEENVLLTNAFYGESSKGEWTIKVIDGAKGRGSNSNDVGSLTKWEMNIFGRLK